jgi:hypothetical protein
VAERERFDRIARTAILADHAQEPDFIPGRGHLAHHVEQFSPEERRRYFGPVAAEAIGLKQLLAALQLVRIGLYPESADAVAVLDYTIDRRATNYLLVANFNVEGTLLDITMESYDAPTEDRFRSQRPVYGLQTPSWMVKLGRPHRGSP